MKNSLLIMVISLFISNLGLSQELSKKELEIFKKSWDKNMIATASYVKAHDVTDYEQVNEEELDEYCQEFNEEEFFSGDRCDPILIAGGVVVCVVFIAAGHFGSKSWRESRKENDVKNFADKANDEAFELAAKWAKPAIEALGEDATEADKNKILIRTIRPFQLDALKKINEYRKKRYSHYF